MTGKHTWWIAAVLWAAVFAVMIHRHHADAPHTGAAMAAKVIHERNQ